MYLLQEGLGVMLLPGDAEALPWEQDAVSAAGTFPQTRLRLFTAKTVELRS